MVMPVSLMLPAPAASKPLAVPAVTLAVQVQPERAAGNVSVTTPSATVAGPALAATMVYVTGVPGTSVVAPSVLVTDRSATSRIVVQVGSVVPPTSGSSERTPAIGLVAVIVP